MTELEHQACLALRGEIDHAGDASARRRLVQGVAQRFGRSEQSVYTWLKQLGWQSGRKARADKGEFSVPEAEVWTIASWLGANRNKRGQPNLPMKEAWLIAKEQGLAIGQLSYPHFVRILNSKGLGLKHMCAEEAGITNVPEHPNHVCLFDISVAIQWYLEKGKPLKQYSDAGARFYEGKPHNIDPSKPKLHRFAWVDLYSGAYFVQYYNTPGESAVDVVDFFWRAMAPKEQGAAYPLRGIPKWLLLDQGSANKAGLVTALLGERGLGVKTEMHMPGNAKANGGVETRHNHWQHTFEGRLRLMPSSDLAAINRQAAEFCAVANAERPNTRTLRAERVRSPMELWSMITSEQLREAPDRETFFGLAAGKAREGTLDGHFYLRGMSRCWYIQGPNVHRGQVVMWRPAPFTEAGVVVEDRDGVELAATEIRFNAISGYPENGPIRRWDDEERKGAAVPTPPAQKVAKKVAAGDIPVALPEVFDPLKRQMDRHAYLVAQGKPWVATTEAANAGPMLGLIEVLEIVRARIDRRLTREENAWWTDRARDGLARAHVEAAFVEFCNPATPRVAQFA